MILCIYWTDQKWIQIHRATDRVYTKTSEWQRVNFTFKAISNILLALSIVYGLNNEGKDRVESGKKFQVPLLSRNTGNWPNNDILLLTL